MDGTRGQTLKTRASYIWRMERSLPESCSRQLKMTVAYGIFRIVYLNLRANVFEYEIN